jgi:hypothetical protein
MNISKLLQMFLLLQRELDARETTKPDSEMCVLWMSMLIRRVARGDFKSGHLGEIQLVSAV